MLQDMLPLPAWLSGARVTSSDFCIFLPHPVALAIAVGKLKSFAIPSPYHSGESVPRWLQHTLTHATRQAFAATVDESISHAPFQLSEISALIDDLRVVCNNSPSIALKEWIDALDKCGSELTPYYESRCKLTKKKLTQFCLLSTQVKDDKNLKAAIVCACKLVLPPALLQVAMDTIDSTHIPRADELCRSRFLVDAAYMHWIRVRNAIPRQPFARYLSWDASLQYGRDYELVIIKSILVSDLAGLFRSMVRLRSLWNNQPWARPEDRNALERLQAEEKEIMNDARPRMKFHALPATQVGVGAGSFVRKLATFLHAARLEHHTGASLDFFIKEFVFMEVLGSTFDCLKLRRMFFA